ncbi:MAG: hypothetical protein CVU05_13560 [Bacteroidetes bacterium HGW-Bacteroidetes-21]|jgi:hypothetical protein|nr:MAG: hypothetical protein CVU05_13560 [Bacteroidetes bacterium HGW-Bacteroidetes-21]
MNKPKRNLILLFVLVVLAGLYFLSDIILTNKESTFNPDIIKIDTNQITKIIIYQKELQGDSIVLELKDNYWEMRNKELNAPASAGSLHNLFRELAAFKPERLASVSQKDWAEFQVNDSSSTRFTIKNKENQTIIDLILGKISFQAKNGSGMYGNQQRNVDGITYFRINGEDITYAANSFLGMIVNTPPMGWRERTIAQINPVDITRIKVKTPEFAYTLEQKDKIWYLGESAIDSNLIKNYLNQFTYMAFNVFDDNPPAQIESEFELSIETSVASPLTISGKAINDSTLLIHSTINPAWFRVRKDDQQFLQSFAKPEHFRPN